MKFFVGKLNDCYQCYLTKEGVQHYAINSLLYITTMREKCVRMYEKFISQLWMYANAIRVLLKVIFQFLFAPNEIAGNSDEVKKAIQISNPDYDVVIKRLYLYYHMKLVTFGINEERNLIVQFPIFVQAADTIPN